MYNSSLLSKYFRGRRNGTELDDLCLNIFIPLLVTKVLCVSMTLQIT